MFKKIKMKIRDALYDHFLGTGSDGHTDSLYGKMLSHIPENSHILDVGCGNGTSILNNIDKIRYRKIKIDGIDIDSDYIAAANQKLNSKKNTNLITFTRMDISSIENTMEWDFIVFSEIYPVVSDEVMNSLFLKAKKILKPNGRILMIHNICDHPTSFGNWLKPKIKYFTATDFGKYTSMKKFKEHIRYSGLEIEKSTILFNVLLKNFPKEHASKWYYRILSKLGGTNNDQSWRNNNQWLFKIRKIFK